MHGISPCAGGHAHAACRLIFLLAPRTCTLTSPPSPLLHESQTREVVH